MPVASVFVILSSFHFRLLLVCFIIFSPTYFKYDVPTTVLVYCQLIYVFSCLFV